MANGMRRLVLLAALLVVGRELGAPMAAGAQATGPASEASCSSFSQALLSQAYGSSPWQVAPVEQHASAAFQQATTSQVLAALFDQYDKELGALQEQRDPGASVSTQPGSDGAATICTYQADGIFQHGTGTVGLVLVLSDGEWQVLRVRLHDVEHPSSQ
jgi:hypothetical protein